MYIFELRKILLFKVHYDYIKNKYGNKSKLLFTDIDSLMYEIKSEDVYKGFNSNKKILDFSNYLTKSKYYNDSSKLVIDNMKYETAGVTIEEFVGLKPMMYLFLVQDNSDHKKMLLKK